MSLISKGGQYHGLLGSTYLEYPRGVNIKDYWGQQVRIIHIYYPTMSLNTISGELQVRIKQKYIGTGLMESSTFNGQPITLIIRYKNVYFITAHLIYPLLNRHLSDL